MTNIASQNRYTYTENDPVNNIDPSGHSAQSYAAQIAAANSLNEIRNHQQGVAFQNAENSARSAFYGKLDEARAIDHTSQDAINGISDITQGAANGYIKSGADKARQIAKNYGCTPTTTLNAAISTLTKNVNAIKTTVNGQIAEVRINKQVQYDIWLENERLNALYALGAYKGAQNAEEAFLQREAESKWFKEYKKSAAWLIERRKFETDAYFAKPGNLERLILEVRADELKYIARLMNGDQGRKYSEAEAVKIIEFMRSNKGKINSKQLSEIIGKSMTKEATNLVTNGYDAVVLRGSSPEEMNALYNAQKFSEYLAGIQGLMVLPTSSLTLDMNPTYSPSTDPIPAGSAYTFDPNSKTEMIDANGMYNPTSGGSSLVGYYQDINGRWHRPNGQFASNAEMGLQAPESGGTHGNSLNSIKTNYGYALVDKDTGEILKFGETINPNERYTQKYLTENNAEMKILEVGSKQEIHDWQYDMNNYYLNKYGQYPPLVNNSSGY